MSLYILPPFFRSSSERVDAVVALGTDRFEFLGELFIGQDTGVLELTKAIVGEDGKVFIRNDGAQGALSEISNTMNMRMQPCKDICRSIIEFITIEMVCLVGSYLTFCIDIGRSLTIESIGHKDMARINAFTQTRVCRTSPMSVLRWRKGILSYLPIGFKEIAVRMSPSDVVFGVLEGNLLAAFGHEPEAGGLIILYHDIGSLVQRRCYNSNPMQR